MARSSNRYGMRYSSIRYVQRLANGLARLRGREGAIRSTASALNWAIVTHANPRIVAYRAIELATLQTGAYVRRVLDGNR